MKTLTSILLLLGTIASVVGPGLAAAGVSLSPAALATAGLLVASVSGYALRTVNSVDQVRTGSRFATNHRLRNAPVADCACRETRRVSAILEIAA